MKKERKFKTTITRPDGSIVSYTSRWTSRIDARRAARNLLNGRKGKISLSKGKP